MKLKRIFAFTASLLAFCLIFAFFTRLLAPKHVTSLREGALVGEYYLEADAGGEHQVIFLGDCEAYGSFIPVIIWKNYGLTSFVRGSPAQRIWQSYYLLLDTLRYEKPDVVVLSVYALCHGESASEPYNRLTLDGMRWSKTKLDAVKASMTEGESLLSYIFPLLRYHSRWSELSREDIDYLFTKKTVSHNGYLITGGTLAPSALPTPEPLFDYSLPEITLEYLDKIRLVCQQEGIKLVLVKSPMQSDAYYWYDEWDAQVRAYAEQYGLDYYNLINNEEIGIVGSDYADGVHLNFRGAEKTSVYFGKILKENYFVNDSASTAAPTASPTEVPAAPPVAPDGFVAAAPHAATHDEKTCEIWQDKLTKYYDERNEVEK